MTDYNNKDETIEKRILKDRKKDDKLEEFKKNFILSFIKNNIRNKNLIDFILLLISDFNDEDRLYFIEKLIEIDSSLDFFKKIRLESSFSSWS